MNIINFAGIDNAASYISGNKRELRRVILSQGTEKLTLPVTPRKYQVQTAQDNKIFDILDSGETLLFGNPKLSKLKFSSFFPALHHKYPFVVGDKINPADAVVLIEKWRKSKTAVRVIITDSPVNQLFAIMDFAYHEKDGSRDIYFDLTFTEFRDLNILQSNNTGEISTVTGLRNNRADSRSAAGILSFAERNAADSLELAKICTGSFDLSALKNISLNNFKINLKLSAFKF